MQKLPLENISDIQPDKIDPSNSWNLFVWKDNIDRLVQERHISILVILPKKKLFFKVINYVFVKCHQYDIKLISTIHM